jgi:integral membrane protein (TIGR01906 family)
MICVWENLLTHNLLFPTMKNKQLFLFCLVLPVFLLLLSFKIVVGLQNYTPKQLEVMWFLDSKGPLDPTFTDAEKSHLEDVKGVMNKAEFTFYGLLLLVSGMYTINRKKRMVAKLLWYGGISAVAWVVVFAVLGLLSFSWLFTQFHVVFFPQGNWIFPETSLLIRTFPISFFVAVASKIAVLAIVLGTLSSWLGKRLSPSSD